MPPKPTPPSDDLRAMLAEALQAYELTRAAYLRDRLIAEAEQARAAEVVATMQQAEQAARDLLDKAGLAHIVGAPLRLDSPAAPTRRADEAVTAAFTAAQTAYVDLRAALGRLAEAYLAAQQWASARRILPPLLADKSAPLYGLAHDLLCESYYRPGQQALAAGEWEAARQQFASVLGIDSGYRDTAAQRREAYLRPAGQALAAGEWDVVRQHVEPWLKEHKDDQAARDVLCESYYRPGQQALAVGEAELALTYFVTLWDRQRDYRDADALVQKAYGNLPVWAHPKISGLQFVKIPAGEFRYGENKQKTHLAEFWIARTLVTNAQYAVFVKAAGYRAPDHWTNGGPPRGKEQHPVVNVSWEDAQKFCGWAGVSLPGERQWEKAARGHDGRTYPWGEKPPDARRCNFNNQVGDTTAVGSYPEGASPYGVLDMAGNVWEWCEDAHESPGRVLRGGAFLNNVDYMRCAARYWFYPVDRHHDYGFRVVAPSS